MGKNKKGKTKLRRSVSLDADTEAQSAESLALSENDAIRRRDEENRARELSAELCASRAAASRPIPNWIRTSTRVEETWLNVQRRRHAAVEWVEYTDERQLPEVMKLVDGDLSEPYSIFTYRYFVRNWPHLCLLARVDGETVACVVSKAEVEPGPDGAPCYRGYIAMLAVNDAFRRFGIGTALVCRSIERMREAGCDEVMLETEVTNAVALGLYEKLGFARDERLFKYYLNGVDAYRLKLWLSPGSPHGSPVARRA